MCALPIVLNCRNPTIQCSGVQPVADRINARRKDVEKDSEGDVEN